MQTATASHGSARDGYVERGHVRDNRGWLARAEARTLRWLAARIPPRVTSDHLSALGAAGMAGAAAAFAIGGTHPSVLPWVIVGLAANWFGDSLDGTLARVRGTQRPNYGYYLDHALDLVGITVLLAGVAAGGFMTPAIAAAQLCAYLLLMGETFLATYALGTFRMACWGFGPTELRVVLAVGVMALLRSPTVTLPTLGPVLLFDLGGTIATAGMALAFLFSASRNARTLYRAEPLPR